MKAQDTIKKLAAKFHNEKSSNDAFVAIDNTEVIELLNDECVQVQDIMDQETWTMTDGSYITRLDDEYWTGDDIDMFEGE